MENHIQKTSKKNLLKKVIVCVLAIIVILGCVYTIKYFIDNNKQKGSETAKILDEIKIDETKITDKVTEKMLKIEELQKTNSDIVGWIEIEGTDINYPVLQTTDNEYYMKHNYKKEEAFNGSIFLDKDYDWELPSTNLLIYGHNNKNGTMFEELLNYKEEDYYKQHHTINFTTNTEDVQYEIIAVFYSRVYYKSETNVFRYYYFINAETESEFNEYVNNSKNASLYDTGKTAEYGDQLLTLSTCSYHTEDGRFAVVAKKIIKQGE